MEQALFIIGQLLKSRFKDQTLFLNVGGENISVNQRIACLQTMY